MICIASVIILGHMGILIRLILPIYEHSISFHLFVSSSVPLMSYSFQYTGILPL